MNVWTEHRNPEGRTYWFNTGTRESVWEKPDDLKTPFEKALNQTKWKEYFSGGRKYYYNTDSKESKWDMPDELILILEKVEKDANTAQTSSALVPVNAPNFVSSPGSSTQGALVPTGGADISSSASQPSQTLNGIDGAVGPHTGGLPFSSSSVLPARPNLPDDPVIPHNGFLSVEEGEKAFIHLLKKAGVDANWTWDQTMRAIITDPLYKALNTLAEKKACWQKYTEGLKAKEQEEKEARLSKLRPAIRNMLRGNPNVFHYTTFTTADKLFSQHPIWQQARVESERKLIFEEYVAELKQREVQETRAARSRSISKVVALFKQLNVDVTTRWRKAQEMLAESDEWINDNELKKLPTLDVLLAFEDYSRVREREFEEQMRRSQVEKTRRERKAREAFRDLLHGLVESGRIKARSKWKQVYPTFAQDERYLNMLGNPGSNPLELFWDVVDGLDQALDAKLAVVNEVIQRHNGQLKGTNGDGDKMNVDDAQGFTVGAETNEEDFMAVIKADSDLAIKQLSSEDFSEVYHTLHDQAVKKQSDERRRAERKQRHLQDDLRYALKKLPEPLDIGVSYEQAIPFIEHLPEYQAIEDDEGRRLAFAKFIKRQKERLREANSEDGGSTTSRKRKEPARDHREPDRERERDRDREREKEKEKDQREPHRDRDRTRDYDKESRSSKYPPRDEHESHRSSRDYSRDYTKERARSRDYGKDYDRDRDRDRDYDREPSHKSSKHHRDSERDDRRRDRRTSRSDHDGGYGGRDWEESPAYPAAPEERGRSGSAYRDEPRDKREHYEDRTYSERAEKRPRYDREEGEPMEVEPERHKASSAREETPEEGEI